jgi:PAS domain S-box-containing protein
MDQSHPDGTKLDIKKKQHLGKLLAILIILVSSLITVITTAVQLWFDYSEEINIVDFRFNEIEDAHVGAIVDSLWSYDNKLTQIQLNGISSVSEIEFAEIKTAENNKTFTAGVGIPKNYIIAEFPIIKEKESGVTELLAKLYLYASKDKIYARLVNRFIVILLSNALKTFIVAGFILMLFQYLITRHLNSLAQFARRIDIHNPSSLEKSFCLDRKSKNSENELDDVVIAMEEMRGKLLASLKQLNKNQEELERHQNQLEELVKERTIELKKSETSLINLISNLDGMVYYCKNDTDWTMDFVSNGSLELTGYKPEDLERNNVISFNEIIYPDDREAVWDNVQEALKNKVPFILNYRITTLEGNLKYVWEQGRGVWSNNGGLEGLQGFITDITKQIDAEQQVKNSQAQLIHMEKLSALGKLTGSISHEFNNPLQGIRNVLNFMSRSSPSKKEENLASLGKKECDRMAKMIRGLRDFYKPTSGNFCSIDINQCLEEVLILQNNSLAEKYIQVNKEFSDNLPVVEVVEDQIKQVILNLVQNAADSISGEGRITLTTEKQDSNLIIKIQDTGHGISEDDKENLFEPFFTTKDAEQGTGLGLSISYGIIRDHGGDIEVESELDKGTTFIISIPIKIK